MRHADDDRDYEGGYGMVGGECEKFTVSMAKSMEADLRGDKRKYKEAVLCWQRFVQGIVLGHVVVWGFLLIRAFARGKL